MNSFEISLFFNCMLGGTLLLMIVWIRLLNIKVKELEAKKEDE